MLPGGQSSLVATKTEKLVGDRSIRMQMMFVNGSTNKKIQRTRSHEVSLFDQLGPGRLGKVGRYTFLRARTERMPCRTFPRLHFLSLEKLSMICALLNKAPSRVALASGACQKPGVLGFQPASKTEQIVAEIGPVPSFHLLGSLAREGAFFPQTLRIRRLVPTSKPLHIVIHSPICSPLAAICGTRLSPKNHATVEMAHALVLPITMPILRFFFFYLCGGCSLRSVAVNLNRVYAYHREFLRLRVRLA